MSTHNIPYSILKKKISLNYPESAAMGVFFKGLKNKFETAMVNEPSVFEPLKIYCIIMKKHRNTVDLRKATVPYKFYVLGQIGLSKQCRPRSDCF